MAITVLLVDDVAEVRGVVRQTLRVRGGFEVVGEASDAAEAVTAAAQHQPDVVVLDLGLPDLAGQEVIARVRAAAPHSKIVVYTGSVTAERLGPVEIEAFVRKDQDVRYLVDLLTDLARSDHHTDTVDLGPDLQDVGRARRFVTERCDAWGCAGATEDAAVVVSELVTNALVHAGARCRLQVRLANGLLRLEVADTGAGVPDPQDAGDDSEHGRGLLMVSALSVAWGVEDQAAGGKLVWAELVVPLDTGGHADLRSSEPGTGRGHSAEDRRPATATAPSSDHAPSSCSGPRLRARRRCRAGERERQPG